MDKTHKTTSIQPNIGLDDEQRESVVKMLNQHVANLHVLYVKTRNYHWNLTGPRFHTLHEFFESQYDQLAEAIDEFAERIRQLGGVSFGTMQEFTRTATLQEEPGVIPDADTMIDKLLNDHEAIIQMLRLDIDSTDQIGDIGTNDFLTGKLQDHEKMAWMLRAHLAGEN
jgi:starvation-inducible DNA-binding protein